MSYSFYKVVHLVGVMSLFIGLATILILAYTGQLKSKPARLLGFLTHGLGLLVIFVSGFGLLARLNFFANMPGWAYAKIGAWVLMGVVIALLRRKPGLLYFNLILILAIGGTAAYLAVNKPF